jgi:hypothetical protein
MNGTLTVHCLGQHIKFKVYFTVTGRLYIKDNSKDGISTLLQGFAGNSKVSITQHTHPGRVVHVSGVILIL